MKMEEIVGQDVSLENKVSANNKLQELRGKFASTGMTQLTHGRPTFSYERSEVLTTAKVNIYGQILKTRLAGGYL